MNRPLGLAAKYPYGESRCGPRSTGDFRFVQPITPDVAQQVLDRKSAGGTVRAQLSGVEVRVVREDTNEPFDGKVSAAASVTL